MLDTAPLPIPSPHLAQAPVETLLRHFSTALPWLSDAHGLVQTGQLKDGKSTSKYPQLYLQDGSLFSKGLYPDQGMKALCFFEYDGVSEMAWDDPIPVSGYMTHQLAVVVWVNLSAIDPNRVYDFTSELAQDFLIRGLVASPLQADIQPAGIDQRAERIFSRYPGWPTDRQLLMYPYSGFRVAFTVRARLMACPLPFVPAQPLPVVDVPATVVASTDIPLGSLVGYNSQGATILYDATKDPETQTFYGIAVTSGTAGQQLQVKTTGLVHIDGWGLRQGTTYVAGPHGHLVTTNDGLYFSQTMGRAVTADDFQLDPRDITIL